MIKEDFWEFPNFIYWYIDSLKLKVYSQKIGNMICLLSIKYAMTM